MNRGSRADVLRRTSAALEGLSLKNRKLSLTKDQKRGETLLHCKNFRCCTRDLGSAAPYRTVPYRASSRYAQTDPLTSRRKKAYPDKKARKKEDKMYRFVPNIDVIAPAERCVLHCTRLSISDRWRESRRKTEGGRRGRERRAGGLHDDRGG